jgi:drug/metabolite transporter superfamily protein YnfA
MSKRAGLLSEFWLFLKENKKWWLLPIVIIALALGALIFLSSTPAAPFIYTLF